MAIDNLFLTTASSVLDPWMVWHGSLIIFFASETPQNCIIYIQIQHNKTKARTIAKEEGWDQFAFSL